jgi:hypothetical protein
MLISVLLKQVRSAAHRNLIEISGGYTIMNEPGDDLINAWRDGYTPKAQYMSAVDAAMSPDGLMDTKARLDAIPIWEFKQNHAGVCASFLHPELQLVPLVDRR